MWAQSTSDVRALQSPDQSTREAATYFDSKQVTVQVSLTGGFSGNLHLYAVDWDSKGRRESITVNDGNGNQTASLSSDFSQGAWATFAVNVAAGGTLSITVTDTGGPNAVLSGIFLGGQSSSSGSGSSGSSGSSVQSSPQGNWVGAFGSSGYDLAGWTGSGDQVSIPSGSVSLSHGSRYVWAQSTSDVRALQSPDQSTREAATYFDSKQVTVQVSLTGGFSGNLHLYAVDWDSKGRRESITVNDGNGNQTASLSSDFSQGAWATFAVNVAAGGTLSITVTDTGGPNAVLSGIFLGGQSSSSGSGSSGSSGSSVQSSPQGNWVGAFGSSGYDLAGWTGSGDQVSIPSGSVSLSHGSRYVWAQSTSDVRALQSPDQSTREAATYFDSKQVTVQVSLTGGFSGNLHLYAVDWDSKGRRESITVNDGNGNQTASLSSDFSQGAWATFAVNVAAGGTLSITVTDTGGPNAVLSGIFLGEGGSPPAGQCVAQSGSVLPPPFLIGVWQQPDDSFAKWAGRGINTIVDDMQLQSPGDSFSTWEQKLACQNLFAIRQPQQSLAQENVDPRLLAFAEGPWQGPTGWDDEPDVTDASPEQLQATYNQWKAGAPSKPVIETLSGGRLYADQGNVSYGGRYVWAQSTTDTRGLQSPDGSTREATGYSDLNEIRLQLTFANAFSGNLHLYAVDWDSQGRRELITVDDGTHSQSASLNSDFSSGAWVGFGLNVPAGATVSIAVGNGAGPNAVLNGLFLDQAATPLSAPQVSSGGGNWVGTYGSAGYDLAAWNGSSDLLSLPGVSLTVGTTASQLYAGWLGSADWIANDIYPVSAFNSPNWIDLSQTAQPPFGYVEGELSQWSGGKPQYQFIETAGASSGTNRAPTADEFRGEVWDAIIHGVRGIFYFPWYGGQYDAISPAVVTEMTNQDATIAELGPILVAAGGQQSAPVPFEVATRTYCGATYTITLNFSHQTDSYQGTAYSPYQVQISPTPPSPLPTC